MDLQRVGVVGAGLMGGGIAEVCARAGLEVAVIEVNEEFAAAGRRRVENSLNKAVDRGKLAGGDRDAALGRLAFGTDLGAMADRDLVGEAGVEDPAGKMGVLP